MEQSGAGALCARLLECTWTSIAPGVEAEPAAAAVDAHGVRNASGARAAARGGGLWRGRWRRCAGVVLSEARCRRFGRMHIKEEQSQRDVCCGRVNVLTLDVGGERGDLAQRSQWQAVARDVLHVEKARHDQPSPCRGAPARMEHVARVDADVT